jgi:hydroxymethylpyrimidine pyrophosphatase-like HAD family hydrolase
MEKKMTAVEWYRQKQIDLQMDFEDCKISKKVLIAEREQLFTQAKQMEREQIEEAIVVCLEEYGCNIPLPKDAQKEIASNYLIQTYGK